MFKRTSTIALAVMLVFATVTTAVAISWGEPDGTDHPQVGQVAFQPSADSYDVYWCTGTMLTPHVMLTAGHCTSEGGVPNYKTWVSFDPQITFPEDVVDDESRIEYMDANWISGTAIPHPDYNDYAEWPNTYDVGVILFDEAVTRPEYGQLPEIGLLATLVKGEARKDGWFTAVGYGIQGLVPHYVDYWSRYQGEVSLIEINSAWNGDGQGAKFTNSPGKGNGQGGTCFGDSGGPVFFQDTNVVSAIVSWGVTPCIGVDMQFRIDTAIAQDFVAPYLSYQP
jgi:hypothetical protein